MQIPNTVQDPLCNYLSVQDRPQDLRLIPKPFLSRLKSPINTHILILDNQFVRKIQQSVFADALAHRIREIHMYTDNGCKMPVSPALQFFCKDSRMIPPVSGRVMDSGRSKKHLPVDPWKAIRQLYSNAAHGLAVCLCAFTGLKKLKQFLTLPFCRDTLCPEIQQLLIIFRIVNIQQASQILSLNRLGIQPLQRTF